MEMFSVRKPRRFNHQYIYVNERKEKLDKMKEEAKRELGMMPPEEFDPESIRGKFVESTTYLKRRKNSNRKPLGVGVIIIIILVLLFFWHYLYTGNWSFLS